MSRDDARPVNRPATLVGTPSGSSTPAPVLGVRTVPAWSVRVLFAAIALVLVLVGVPEGPWTGIAALLVGVSVWRPRWLTAWVLIGVLLLSSLVEPGTLTPRVLGLIAGAHALHLLGGWMLALPAAARLQPAVLLPSLRRFVLIQVPAQLAAVVLFVVRGAGTASSVPVLAAVSGIALAALVGLLLPVLLRRAPR
ncbi:hypothetical protein [Leifsonia sp. 1010]|uniref:hypothetical protein n=1 Tax=Leifsonia sp. 1010 TaxID=2817769 RepID=UPI00285601D4|nr:hypothetical protein [Leifsonia sp. 1010]MDR6613434.1 hypothetical protein [Leifsonia sp. 1010]